MATVPTQPTSPELRWDKNGARAQSDVSSPATSSRLWAELRGFPRQEQDLGTLEPGKLADMVVLTGNPLEGYWNTLTAVMTIKGGEVVVDKRSELRTIKVLP